MVEEGADILDIGAMSTAPYRRGSIGAAQEERRMTAAVRAVRDAVDVPISVDTQRSGVAAAALRAGASIINDVSGLAHDPQMGEIARSAGGVILMANGIGPSPLPPLQLVTKVLRACLTRARAAQLQPNGIVLDPGIGFFRRASVAWDVVDCLILHDLQRLRRLGRPLLVGISRKSFIGKLTGRAAPEERLYGSIAAVAIAVYHGAALIRAHDVAATRDAARVARAIASVQ